MELMKVGLYVVQYKSPPNETWLTIPIIYGDIDDAVRAASAYDVYRIVMLMGEAHGG